MSASWAVLGRNLTVVFGKLKGGILSVSADIVLYVIACIVLNMIFLISNVILCELHE